MDNEFVKLRKLNAVYLCLLKKASHGEERTRLFESTSTRGRELRDLIEFLEKEIVKLKEELSSEGVDVSSCPEINSSSN